MEVISNPFLFEQKKELLESFFLNEDDFYFSTSLSYHGIPLKIHCKNSYLVEQLISILPSDWSLDFHSGFKIYLIAPSQFNLTLDNFTDEASQDCYSFEKNTWAIQRDFAARFLNRHQVVLICEDRLNDGFYNFLRWFISEKLIEKNKFVIHASCVLDAKENAHIFLGHSGAGKTTVTSLSSPRLILGDDMNIISFDVDDNLVVEAGAIGGLYNSMIGYSKQVRVKGIYWLKQSSCNQLFPLDQVVGSQRLLASFANLHWPTIQPEIMEILMDTAIKASSKVPFYQMDFKKDQSFWSMLDE